LIIAKAFAMIKAKIHHQSYQHEHDQGP
jgi:hypothetical protein